MLNYFSIYKPAPKRQAKTNHIVVIHSACHLDTRFCVCVCVCVCVVDCQNKLQNGPNLPFVTSQPTKDEHQFLSWKSGNSKSNEDIHLKNDRKPTQCKTGGTQRHGKAWKTENERQRRWEGRQAGMKVKKKNICLSVGGA